MPAPSAPTNFVVKASGIPLFPGNNLLSTSPGLRLGWDSAGAGVAYRFEFKRSTETNFRPHGDAGGWLGADTPEARVVNLAFGATYEFRVRAENSDGASAWTTVSHNTPAAFPTAAAQLTAPSGLTVTTASSRSALLTWTDNSLLEAGYVLRFVELSTGETRDVVVGLCETSGWMHPDFFEGGLRPATNYLVKIKAVGGKPTLGSGGLYEFPFETAWSTDVAFTTGGDVLVLSRSNAVHEVWNGLAYGITVEPASVDTTADWVTLTDHPWRTGDAVKMTADGFPDATPALNANDIYYLGDRGDDNFSIHPTRLDAFKDTSRVDFTDTNQNNWKIRSILPAVPKIGASGTLFSVTMTGQPNGIDVEIGAGSKVADVGGRPDDVEGFYAGEVEGADGSDTDTVDVFHRVRTPRLSLLAPPQIDGEVGTALSETLEFAKYGPIDDPLVWYLVEGPPWLSVNETTGEITGTPEGAGGYPVTVVASNLQASVSDEPVVPSTLAGFIFGQASFLLVVPALRVTSAAVVNVYEGKEFEHPLTASASNVTWSSEDAPDWVEIEGGTMIITAPDGAADERFSFTVRATIRDDFAELVMTVQVARLIDVDAPWRMTVGQPQIEVVKLLNGTADEWFLSAAPPGLTFATGYDANSVKVTGSPTAAGIFDAVVSVVDGSEVYRKTVRAIVSGGLFIGWFHEEPERRELQVLFRSREVQGYYFVDGALQLIRGDEVTLHIVVRDAPIHGDELGAAIIGDGITDIRLTVRPPNDFDAEPYLELGGEVGAIMDTEEIDGHNVFFVEFKVESDLIERAFEELNRAQGADSAAAALLGMGEVTIVRDGKQHTMRPFSVKILQDVDR